MFALPLMLKACFSHGKLKPIAQMRFTLLSRERSGSEPDFSCRSPGGN